MDRTSPTEKSPNKNIDSKPKETLEKLDSCSLAWEETMEPHWSVVCLQISTRLPGKPKRDNTNPTCTDQWLKIPLWKLAKLKTLKSSSRWKRSSHYLIQLNSFLQVGTSMPIISQTLWKKPKSSTMTFNKNLCHTWNASHLWNQFTTQTLLPQIKQKEQIM